MITDQDLRLAIHDNLNVVALEYLNARDPGVHVIFKTGKITESVAVVPIHGYDKNGRPFALHGNGSGCHIIQLISGEPVWIRAFGNTQQMKEPFRLEMGPAVEEVYVDRQGVPRVGLKSHSFTGKQFVVQDATLIEIEKRPTEKEKRLGIKQAHSILSVISYE